MKVDKNQRYSKFIEIQSEEILINLTLANKIHKHVTQGQREEVTESSLPQI